MSAPAAKKPNLWRDPADWARSWGWLSARQVETLKRRGLFPTQQELNALLACVQTELEHAQTLADAGTFPVDADTAVYIRALRRVARKLGAVRP